MGLSAGFAPGPLLALVISETIQHDITSGVKVALAPVITDIPIVILTLLILSKLSNFNDILGIISLIGSCFILFLGFKSICTKGSKLNYYEIKPKSLTKGILANILNPHPYLFWFSVGAPMINKALSQNFTSALTFIISFYTFLVGSKIALAILVGKSKHFLNGSTYIYIMRFLGVLLCILAFILFYDGMKLLKAI